MMRKLKGKYPLEDEAERLLRALRLSIIKLTNHLTTIPKRKMDRAAWILEIISFTSLLFAILIRM